MLFLLPISTIFGATLSAQTIQIRLVDGRNGHAIELTCIGVYVSTFDKVLGIRTDKNGIARLHFTENDSKIDTVSRPNGCGDWPVIDPVVKYSEFISINAGYVLCQPHAPDYSWLATKKLSTKEVLQSGVATPNTCGKATESPSPGEIVLFVRPLTFWEKLKSY